MSQSFSVLQWPELEQVLFGFCLEIRQTGAAFRKNKQAEDQEVLNRISALMWQKAAPDSWDAAVADAFVSLLLTVLQQQLGRVDQNDSAIVAKIRRQIDIACSLVASLPQVANITRLRVSGLWTRSRLLTGLPAEDPAEWIVGLVEAMSVLGLDGEAVRNQSKAQYVMRASNLLQAGLLPEPAVNITREWCAELIALPEFRGFLKAAANTLSVGIPKTDEQAGPGVQGPITAMPQTFAPGMLRVPEALSDEAASELRNTILFQLYAQSGVPNSTLSEQTKKQVNELLPATPAERMNTTFYYAGVNLWKGYWTTGDAQILEIVRSIGQYLCAAYAAQTPPHDRDKSNAVQLWIAAQLPEFLLTCEIKQLVEAVNQLCRHIKTRVNDLAIKETIIEAFAGYCRRLQTEGQGEDKVDLLKEYGPDLRQIHGEYDSRTGEMAAKPWITKSREDEQAACDFLFPS